MLTAAPVISAASLAKDLDMAIPNAAAFLDQFTAAGIAVEVTHRSKQRLFGLAMFAPLWRSQPRRPETGRGRGRPPSIRDEKVVADPLPFPFLALQAMAGKSGAP